MNQNSYEREEEIKSQSLCEILDIVILTLEICLSKNFFNYS